MEELRTTHSRGSRLHPFRSLLILLGFVLIGMSVGGLLAMVVLLGWTTAQGEDAVLNAGEMLTNPELFEGSWYALMMVQAVSHAFTFLVPCPACCSGVCSKAGGGRISTPARSPPCSRSGWWRC